MKWREKINSIPKTNPRKGHMELESSNQNRSQDIQHQRLERDVAKTAKNIKAWNSRESNNSRERNDSECDPLVWSWLGRGTWDKRPTQFFLLLGGSPASREGQSQSSTKISIRQPQTTNLNVGKCGVDWEKVGIDMVGRLDCSPERGLYEEVGTTAATLWPLLLLLLVGLGEARIRRIGVLEIVGKAT